MGFVVHNAIVVTCWNKKLANKCRRKAIEFGIPCSSVVESGVNSYHSFMTSPDGSKSGWHEDYAGCTCRQKFVLYLRGLCGVEWAEVEYGNDTGKAFVTESAWGINYGETGAYL